MGTTKEQLIALLVSKGYDNNASKTQQDLYTVINRGQLFSKSNRLNSGWARGKYIIATYLDDHKKLDDFLKFWRNKVETFGDQILCLEVESGVWKFFDYKGVEVDLKIDPPQLKNVITNSRLIIEKKKLTDFILETVSYFDKIDHLNKIVPFAGLSNPFIKVSGEKFKLTRMFIETDIQDIKKRNAGHVRWFEKQFALGERKVFLTNQWNSTGEYDLLLSSFIEMVRCCYGVDYYYKPGPNLEHQLWQGSTDVFPLNKYAAAYVPDKPLQLIYFGAPGTAKSTTIKRQVAGRCEYRMTFHPDTDYSSFVGCYKPTQEEGCKEITYSFVEQPFTMAYVEAWKRLCNSDILNEKKAVYLVIEEINRGNCAQIFGDIFQLLDRDEKGYSDYRITPDTDLQRFLQKAFSGFVMDGAPGCVVDGSRMILPPNLYIWATMNTSDQSLFPIDSAFKRRWEWRYLPIKDEKKGHYIELDKKTFYDWYFFLDKINQRIEKLTESEDKQLGYWFVIAENNKISLETFVGKVVFYLWNDVFKDYGNDVNSPFTIKLNDDKRDRLRYRSFYNEDGSINVDNTKLFIESLGVEPIRVGNSNEPLVTKDYEESFVQNRMFMPNNLTVATEVEPAMEIEDEAHSIFVNEEEVDDLF